ncbi:MAG: HU family DNA-binding protein [Sarcina sp.]
MKKLELLKSIAEKTGVSQKVADEVLVAFVETVKEEVREGGKVSLGGFGTFSLKESAARVCRNPKTGEEIQVEASTGLKFKQSSVVKEEFNK